MAGRRVTPQRSVSSLSVPTPADPVVGHAVLQLEQAVNKLQATRERVVVTVDLVVGRNIVRHGLGRPCRGYTITPTSTAAFTHAIALENPHPEREIWIDILSAGQAGARVEVF